MSDERATNSGREPETQDAPAPTNRTLPDGQHADHWILSDEERAKGFIRPVRVAYRHVGPAGPIYPLADLTAEQEERFAGQGYVQFERYPEDPDSALIGHYWTRAALDAVGNGCGRVTTMSIRIAETYARQPAFYGSTFCAACHAYLPVGKDGEFVWLDDGTRVGT